jgi:hypothetical protein
LDRTHPNASSLVSIPVLVEALASANSDVRLHAARALQPLANNPRAAEAIPALLAILRKCFAGIERHGNRQPNTRLADPDPADETTDRSASLNGDRGCGRTGRGARGTDHHRDRLVSTGRAALHAVIQLGLQ